MNFYLPISLLLFTLHILLPWTTATSKGLKYQENDDVIVIRSSSSEEDHSRQKRQVFYPPFYIYGHRPIYYYESVPVPAKPVGGGFSSGNDNGTADVGKEFDCSNKVVGGTDGKPNNFPWMAALFKRGRQGCGGSLIDSRHILTAAHCVARMKPEDVSALRVYLGTHDITAPSEPYRQVYKVSRVFFHSEFSMDSFYHDIALIRLETAVPQFDSKIYPICLSDGQPPYDQDGSTAHLIGWGKLGQNAAQPGKLQQVQLSVWSNEKCSSKYGSYSPAGITDGMVCAGQKGKDACNGDSGGPLMRVHPVQKTRTEQIGIVSWGIGCGEYPGVYTRVDKYHEWVERVKQIRDYYG